jgi:hypothetical protein
MIPNLEYAYLQEYAKKLNNDGKMHICILSLECVCVSILLFHCFLFPLLGYLITVTT